MKEIVLKRTLIPILFIALVLFSFSCGKTRKTGFALQNEIYGDELLPEDTTQQIYIKDTKPIDSIDVDKLIYNIWRIETDEYPTNLKVYARVFDSLGNFVTNMADPYKKEGDSNIYFTSYREKLGRHYNIREEIIDNFKVREFGAGDSIPYNIVLSVDYSGSMSAVKDAIFEGTELFISLKAPYDNILLSSFNNKYDLKVPFESSKDKLLAKYRKNRDRNFGLWSAMLSAVDSSLTLMENTSEKDPRILAVFSDGDDNSSKVEIENLIKRAKDMKVNIFTVAFGYSKDEQLQALAKHTGGKFYRARSKQELIDIFRDIYMSLRYYYLVSYAPPEYYSLHQVFAGLNVPGRQDSLLATGEYDMNDFEWTDTTNAFDREILFEFDSAIVRKESYPILDAIVDAMMTRPRVRVQIEGHTDNVGPAGREIEYNQDLSTRRAKAVYDELVKRGIEERRLRYRGFGMSQPISPNDTEAGRAKNRRTVFRILAK